MHIRRTAYIFERRAAPYPAQQRDNNNNPQAPGPSRLKVLPMHKKLPKGRLTQEILLFPMRTLHLRVPGHAHPRTVDAERVPDPADSATALYATCREIIHAGDRTVRNPGKGWEAETVLAAVLEMGREAL